MAKLVVIWSNPSYLSSEKMLAMYTTNALKYGWWDEVVVVIWGETTKLVAEDAKFQELVKRMIDAGVKVSACRACAEQLGVDKILKEIGVEVIYWGVPLTEALKSGEDRVLVF